MPLDERQRQIHERAGLEESRLNLEFIDWLSRWGTPILVVVAILAGGYWVREKWRRSANDKVDRAFTQYEDAAAPLNPSPDALTAVANEFSGVRSVPVLARLNAADAYLDMARRGIKPGTELDKDGGVKSPDDLLTEEEKRSMLERASGLYQDVFDDTKGDKSRMLLHVGAAYGLAAVAESREEWDKARSLYQGIIDLTKGTTFEAHTRLAQTRMDRLANLKDLPKLLAKADLQPLPPELLPPPPAPPPTPAPQPSQPEPGAAAPGQPSAPIPAPADAPATTPAQPGQPAPAEPQPVPPR